MNEEILTSDPLTSIAKKHFGIDYLFPYQRLAVFNILEAAGVPGFAPAPQVNPVTGERETPDTAPHQIIILPTGAGKSLCFMLPAILLEGATLVVFPLLSLIADQARRLIEAKMKPGVLRGGQSRAEREEVWRGVESGEIKMVLTNPETALSPKVLPKLKELNIQHLVIDEMHTVSEWGESFRPVYLEIGRLAPEAGIQSVTAFTATASPLILEKVKKIVFPGLSPNIITANPDRPNISYRVISCLSKNHELVNLLSKGDSSVKRPAIVFCSSRTGTELTAALLRRRLKENQIYFYHAGLTKEEKADVEKWFFDSGNGILVATCAYGMGVDKKNIRTVIHMDIPSSIEAYLQESGRGGRDRNQAAAVLLVSPEDNKKVRKMAEGTAKERYKKLIAVTQNSRQCRREQLLKLLEAEPEACFGCDVCDGTVQESEAGKSEIIFFFKNNPRQYTKKQAKQLLSAESGYDLEEIIPVPVPGRGSLMEWNEDDIAEAVENCLLNKYIYEHKRGFWKGKINGARRG